MNDAQLRYFEDLLLGMRERVARGMDEQEESLDISLTDSISELSTYDNHPADIGTETFERSKDFALRDNARLVIGAIEDALDRISQGLYGYCERCGDQIPADRLQALPYTTMCMACRAGGEMRDHVGRRRPIEEEVLMPPWQYSNDPTSVTYDREDGWQDVAQHGLSTEIEEVEGEDRGVVQDIEGVLHEEIDGVIYESTRVTGDNPPAVD